jgi:diguanylate cyclase (GGDEF)-like protein
MGTAVVFLTAHSDDPTVERAKLAGPSGYLVKPVSAPALKVAVELALDQQMRDTSARLMERALSETAADLLSLLNHLPLAIQMEDAQGRVVHLNLAFCSLFDIPEDRRLAALGIDGATLMECVQEHCVDSERFAVVVDTLRHSRRPVSGDVISLLDGRKLEVDYVPLFQGSRRHGVLWTYRDISVSERTRQDLEESAARHRQEILVDSLTGLTNRRGFFELAPTYLKLARCTGEHKRVLFFIDLDGLKAINDQQGHATGDAAICAVARALRGTFRVSDLLVRLAGDEFVVLATMTAPDIDLVKARLTARLSQLYGNVAESCSLGVSVGMAEYLPGESLDALVLRADQAMYRDKHSGRRRELPRER